MKSLPRIGEGFDFLTGCSSPVVLTASLVSGSTKAWVGTGAGAKEISLYGHTHSSSQISGLSGITTDLLFNNTVTASKTSTSAKTADVNIGTVDIHEYHILKVIATTLQYNIIDTATNEDVSSNGAYYQYLNLTTSWGTMISNIVNDTISFNVFVIGSEVISPDNTYCSHITFTNALRIIFTSGYSSKSTWTATVTLSVQIYGFKFM